MHETLAYNSMAMIYSEQGKNEDSLNALYDALKAEEKAGEKSGLPPIHYSIGSLLKKMGRNNKAKEHLGLAAEGFRDAIKERPNLVKLHIRLGDTLAENGKFPEAAKAFESAVKLGKHLDIFLQDNWDAIEAQAIEETEEEYSYGPDEEDFGGCNE